MTSDATLTALQSAIGVLAASGNGAVSFVDDEGRLALVTSNLAETPWERELAASALAILAAIQTEVREHLAQRGTSTAGLREALGEAIASSPDVARIVELATGEGS